MTVRRLLFIPFVLAALLLPATRARYSQAMSVVPKESTVRQKREAQVRYVCPMHADIESKSRGTCPKCKMSLIRKRAVSATAKLTRQSASRPVESR